MSDATVNFMAQCSRTPLLTLTVRIDPAGLGQEKTEALVTAIAAAVAVSLTAEQRLAMGAQLDTEMARLRRRT